MTHNAIFIFIDPTVSLLNQILLSESIPPRNPPNVRALFSCSILPSLILNKENEQVSHIS